jgi:hypothetical protein
VNCDDGALVFAHDGTIYALNMTALGKGYLGIDPIWRNEARALSPPIKGGPDAFDRLGSAAV